MPDTPTMCPIPPTVAGNTPDGANNDNMAIMSASLITHDTTQH